MKFGDCFNCWRWASELESGSESEYGAFIYHHSHTLRSWFLQGWDTFRFLYIFTTYDPICLTWHTYGIMEHFCWMLRLGTSDPLCMASKSVRF